MSASWHTTLACRKSDCAQTEYRVIITTQMGVFSSRGLMHLMLLALIVQITLTLVQMIFAFQRMQLTHPSGTCHLAWMEQHLVPVRWELGVTSSCTSRSLALWLQLPKPLCNGIGKQAIAAPQDQMLQAPAIMCRANHSQIGVLPSGLASIAQRLQALMQTTMISAVPRQTEPGKLARRSSPPVRMSN